MSMNQFSFQNVYECVGYAQQNKYELLAALPFHKPYSQKQNAYTVSLCEHCYQHVPAVRAQLNGSIFLIKSCAEHGVTQHMIERDADFYHSLKCNKQALNYDNILLTEASDRCQLKCPHCYHKPDNEIIDEEAGTIIDRVKTALDIGINSLELAGAEASLRPDFAEMVKNLKGYFKIVNTMTNGVRFADKKFFNNCIDNGLTYINVGLNHPSYINNTTIRQKQIDAINHAHRTGHLGYIGYTMVGLKELHDILEEIIFQPWTPKTFRIRAGSEIGLNATEKRYYVSDIYKEIKQWAKQRGYAVEDMEADDNIYHKMVRLNGKPIRIIQWCDITDIDMEELRSGPWNDFVPNDGITNFLHQIIRRDVWKNKGIQLTDTPPQRYQLAYYKDFPKELNLTQSHTLCNSSERTIKK